MTPKEKAKKLIDKYYYYLPLISMKEVKIFALICCDEVLGSMGADRGYEFWIEVINEIINYEQKKS